MGAGTWFATRQQLCVSACDYRLGTPIGGNDICETTDDTANCPFLQFAQVQDTFLTCISACPALSFINGSFTQCVSACPSVAKFLQEDGLTCASSCSSQMFTMTGTTPQCVSSCAFPKVNLPNNTYATGYKNCEATCATSLGAGTWFATRQQLCVSACDYRLGT